MSVFSACQIGSYGCGMTNQLNMLIGELIDALVHHRPLVIFGKFRKNYNTASLVPLREVFDLPSIEELLGDRLHIYESDQVELELVSAYYGTYADGANVTDKVREKFWNNQQASLRIPSGTSMNTALGIDPVHGQVKRLHLKFKIGTDLIHIDHPEVITTEVLHKITDTPGRYNRPSLVYQDIYNVLLRDIKFHPSLYAMADQTLSSWSLKSGVNLIHIRNDDDAIEFWSKINGMSPTEFESTLNKKYIATIDQYFNKDDDVIVLTATPNNPVCEYLSVNGYAYHVSTKIPGQREIDAIVDLIISRACNKTFISSLNPQTLRGSTYDNPVWKRLDPRVTCVFIDLDNVNDLPQVLTT